MVFLSLLLLASLAPTPPDVLPAGHRGIVHELVFEDGPLLEEHTLVASPVQGFGGVHVVVPGEPFRFSSKYGTTLYLLPEGAAMERAPRFDEEPPPFPSARPPVGEIRSVPMVSLVQSVITTCRLVAVDGGTLEIEVVDDVRTGPGGVPIGIGMRLAPWGLVAAFGAGICAVVLRRRRRRVAE